MKVKTKFYILDNWQVAEAKGKSENIFCVELNSGKILAVHADTSLTDRVNAQKSHVSLWQAVKKAMKLGQVSGVFDMYINEGVKFIECNLQNI